LLPSMPSSFASPFRLPWAAVMTAIGPRSTPLSPSHKSRHTCRFLSSRRPADKAMSVCCLSPPPRGRGRGVRGFE
jgi:hypothetical protein